MPGLLRGIARTAVVAGTASAVSGRVRHRQQGRWARQEQEEQQAAYAQQAPPPAPAPQYAASPAAPSTDDKLAQLQQLGELKAAGVLTDAEFQAQKGKILYG